MAPETGPSLARGMQVAAQMFPPGAPVAAPRFDYPTEIAAEWSAFSVSTVLGDVWGRPGLDSEATSRHLDRHAHRTLQARPASRLHRRRVEPRSHPRRNL